MTTLKRYIDTQLPWSSSANENKRFGALAILFLVCVIVCGFIIQNTVVPEKSREEKEKLPPQLAKVILKKKEEPPPPPPPPKEEEKKPEPEPEKEEEKPEPEKKEEPKPEEVKKAREKAKKSGLLAMQDDLAAMRDSFQTPPPSQKLSKGDTRATEVKRSVITGSATNTSGGIQTAAAPSVSGVAALEGRDTTQVDSVSLGGSTVEGDAEMQEASSGSEGVRSEEQIRAVLDQNKGALYAIYNRALRSDPTLQGKVTFELVIEPDGSVSECKIVSSELEDSKVESRLVSRMRLINFGAADVGSIKTRWAIDFLPY